MNQTKNNQLKTKKCYSPRNILFHRKTQKLKNLKLGSDIFSFDEEYVSKLKYFNSELNLNSQKKTLYNLNTSTHLPDVFKNYHINDNKKLKERIISKINIKKQIFEKKIYDDLEHTTYVGRIENIFKENTLENKRQELEIKIKKIKDLMDSLSKELSDILTQIEDSKIDLEIFNNYKNYSLLDDKKYQKKNLNLDSQRSSNDNNNDNNNDNSFEQAIRIKKGIEKRMLKEMIKKRQKMIIEEKKLNIYEKIKMLNDKKNNILVKLDSCDRDLREFKGKHNSIKYELLVHYHKLLLEGRDTRKDGLSWIIKSIWNLKSNVIMSFLPKFLDLNSIAFLFLYTDKLVKIEKMQKKIEIMNNEIKKREKKSKKLAHLSNMILNNNDGKNHLNNINLHNKNVKIIYRNLNKENINDYNNIYEINNRISLTKNINSISNNANSTNNIKDINNLKGINKKLKLASYQVNNKKLKNFSSQPELVSMHNIQNIDNFIENPKIPEVNTNNFDETFKTSLYKTNSLNNNNLNNSTISEFTNNSTKKNDINNKELKNIFLEPENLSLFNSNAPQKKMTIKDYANFKTFKIEESFDSELMNLIKTHKEMKYKLKNMKNDADKLARKEIERVGKCFYLEDYKGKFNTNLKTVIGALIGEDNAGKELLRQEKEEKDYFKTIKNIRNFNGFYNKKYI